jgi:hypothetical protein
LVSTWCESPAGPNARLEQLQPVVLGEVDEVLVVLRGQWEAGGQAAGSYPGVVDRPRPAPTLCSGSQLAPGVGRCVVDRSTTV